MTFTGKNTKYGTCDYPFLYLKLLINSNLLQSLISKCNSTRNAIKFYGNFVGKKYLLNKQIYNYLYSLGK